MSWGENVVFPSWLLIALLIMLAWSFRPKRYFNKFDWRISDWNMRSWPKRFIVAFVGFSAIIGLNFLLSDVFKVILFFLPRQGNNEGPSLRGRISGTMGLLAEVLIIYFFIKHNEKRRKELSEKDNIRI